MLKKLLIAFFCIQILTVPAWGAQPGTWEDYKQKFITKDGRVIDFYQDQCSHSEGQGYGMLLAVHFNDPKTFSRLFQWTLANLMIRKDGLVAWKWGKRINGEWGIIDYNNASDGDLLIAWACLDAWEKWKNRSYLSTAKTIINSIKKHLVVERYNKKILLPGYFGFDKDKEIKLYPNYYVFPAFFAFAKYHDKHFWNDLAKDGQELVQQSLFSKFRLPANWVLLRTDQNLSIDQKTYGDFHYEAIRIPLYLLMTEEKKLSPSFSSLLTLNENIGYLPVLINLSQEQFSANDAPAGFYAIMSRCAQANKRTTFASKLMKKADQKIIAEKKDYYSNTLYLIAKTMVTL